MFLSKHKNPSKPPRKHQRSSKAFINASRKVSTVVPKHPTLKSNSNPSTLSNPPHQSQLSIDKQVSTNSINPVYPTRFFIEPPDSTVVARATSNTSQDGINARKTIFNYFRTSASQSDLCKPSIPVPYLLPIGESSTTTYPIPEYLIHTLYHLNGTTLANYGLGMAAPQFGVNYRFFILRSELFGLASPITNIPYVLETTDENHCMVQPRKMQRHFAKPTTFEHMALSWDNPNPEVDSVSRPPVNISMSMVDYHDMALDPSILQSKPEAIQYHLQKQLTMPSRDAKQLNLCDDRILLEEVSKPQYDRPQSRALGRSSISSGPKINPNNSFINDYRGYSIPLQDIERLLFTPLLQSFQQNLPATPIINPRVTAVRYEYAALREGCFSFPQWNAFVSRPIACDVEFETLDIQSAQIPTTSNKDCLLSAMLAGSLSNSHGTTKYCPSAQNSGLNSDFLDPHITKQLEISRLIPTPDQVRLVTRKVTLRDIVSRAFLHEYDHLDGIQFFDRCEGKFLSWQPPIRNVKAEPSAKFEYPVNLFAQHF